MSQEVKIKIRGLDGPGEDPVEVVSIGQMYEEGGSVCIAYDEVISEEDNGLVQVGKNLLKISSDQVEVIKKGQSESHMVFVPEQTTVTYYSTPAGELEVGIHTDHIEKTDYEKGFNLQMQYELEMNQTFISSCSVNIAVEQ